MIRSTIYAYWAIKIGLAVVFLWFGIDKFINPDIWINTWLPEGFANFLDGYSVTPKQIIYVFGIFEILAALSFLTGVFLNVFAPLSILFVISGMLFTGFNKEAVYSLGLIGALSSLALWPEDGTGFN